MVTISGKRRRDIFRVKRDIDDFRISDSGKLESQVNPHLVRSGSKLLFNADENIGQSIYIRSGEKLYFNTNTKEVRIK